MDHQSVDLNELLELEGAYLAQQSERRPQVGYLCLRVPVEYLEAAGAIPIRIITDMDDEPAGFSAIRSDGCSFCRSVSTVIKAERYRNLKVVIGGSCCDQMRRLLDVLEEDLDIPVVLFGAPRTWNSDPDYFISEMRSALNQISEVTGHRPADEALWERIRARNDLKEKVQRLREREKLPNRILQQIAVSPLPPEIITTYLERFERFPANDAGVRILLAGSIPAGWEMEVIERAGGHVVSDVTCLGDRAFVNLCSQEGDPVFNLYDSYVERNNCPHRRPVTPLIDYIKSRIELLPVEGIIYRSVKFCHPWGLLAERMKAELPLPLLRIDDDLSSPAMGSLQTRIGAFVEMLKMRRARRA